MGLGFLKAFAPMSFIGVGFLFFILALCGEVRFALMLIVFLSPLRNVIDRLEDYPGGKDFIDYLLFASLVGWVVSSLTKGHKLMERSALNSVSVTTIFYMFISLAVGSVYLHVLTFFDVSDPRVQDWKNFCLFPFFFLLTYNTIRTKKEVLQMLFVMGLAYLLSAYYTVHQISSFDVYSRAKINGTFQFLGPNEVAAFFNQYCVFFLAVLFFVRSRFWKLFLSAVVLIGIYCVLFLFSRGAYLGMLIGLLTLFSFRKRILLIPLIMIPIFWQTVLPEQVKIRILQTHTETGELDESAENRLIIWQQSLQLFQENPIMGIGFGVFRNLGFILGDTHNIYLKLLVEQGLIGFLIFLVTIFIFIQTAWRTYSQSDDELAKGLGLGLLCCLMTMLVNNLFGDRWTYAEVATYLWVAAGLTARMKLIAQKESQVKKKPVVIESDEKEESKKFANTSQLRRTRKKLA